MLAGAEQLYYRLLLIASFASSLYRKSRATPAQTMARRKCMACHLCALKLSQEIAYA